MYMPTDFESVRTRHVNSFWSIEIIVVRDVRGVCAIQRGEVASIRHSVIVPAVTWSVPCAGFDVVPDNIYTAAADLARLKLTQLCIDSRYGGRR